MSEREQQGAAETIEIGSILRQLGPTAVLGALWAVLPPLGSILLFSYMNTVGNWLRGHQESGLVLYAAAFAVLAGVALLPTYASAILGGWAFGFAWGFPAAMAGFTGGAVIGYVIARFVGRDRAMKLIDSHERWRVVRDALVADAPAGHPQEHHWLRTTAMVALLRLPPNSPFALTNLVMSAVKVPIVPFVVGTVLGMAPRTAIAVWLAAETQSVLAEEAAKRPAWLLPVGIVSSLVVLLVIGWIAKAALRRVTGKK